MREKVSSKIRGKRKLIRRLCGKIPSTLGEKTPVSPSESELADATGEL